MTGAQGRYKPLGKAELADHDDQSVCLKAGSATVEVTVLAPDLFQVGRFPEGRTEHLRTLERDREALLQNYAEMMPEALGTLQPEERHRVYNMLRLRTVAFPDGTLEVSGALGEEVRVCKNETIGSRSPST